jgi:hypothetical protein
VNVAGVGWAVAVLTTPTLASSDNPTTAAIFLITIISFHS